MDLDRSMFLRQGRLCLYEVLVDGLRTAGRFLGDFGRRWENELGGNSGKKPVNI